MSEVLFFACGRIQIIFDQYVATSDEQYFLKSGYYIIISLFSPVLDVGLPQGTPLDPIFRFSHPITASYRLQVIGPFGRKASNTTFVEPWPPL